MKIWLDDIREAPTGWIHFTNSEDLINFAKNNLDKIQEVSLDHDLGIFCKKEITGKNFLDWLEEEVYTKGLRKIPNITIHSQNPVGRKNMERCLDSIKKKIEEPCYICNGINGHKPFCSAGKEGEK